MSVSVCCPCSGFTKSVDTDCSRMTVVDCLLHGPYYPALDEPEQLPSITPLNYVEDRSCSLDLLNANLCPKRNQHGQGSQVSGEREILWATYNYIVTI